jgi:hypothetical protein
VLLLLIAGAAVNVAVAWGSSWFGEHPTLAQTKLPLEWPAQVPTHWTAPTNTNAAASYLWSITGWVSIRHEEENGDKVFSYSFIYRRFDFGWPWRSLRSENWYEFHMDLKASKVTEQSIEQLGMPQWRTGWPTKSGFENLPLQPLWPGFAINTLFYAGVLWMLFAFPFALRQMIRRRRGLCAMCAYPIGSSEVCTECGAAVKHL